MRTRWMMAYAISGCLLLLICSCSSSGGAQDAGTDANDAGADPGADLLPRPDHDPSNEFLVSIPAGTSLCSAHNTARTWQEELAMVARIDLAPGHYVFPRTPGVFGADLVERVVFGPDRTDLNPSPVPGEVEGKLDFSWVYHARRQFEHGDTTYRVDIIFAIRKQNDTWPAEVVAVTGDASLTVTAEIQIGPGEDPISEVQRFALCDLDGPFTYSATTEGGDRVLLHMRTGPDWWPCMGIGGEWFCYFLVAADVELAEGTTTVTDRFGLVYAGSHHGWFDQFMVRLDPPLGTIAAVLVIEPTPFGDPGEIVYLDTFWNEVRREGIAEWLE